MNSMPEITRDTVFLATGGARGVTAQCVLRLAEDFPCQWVLIGRSSLLPDPPWAENCMDNSTLKQRILEDLKSQSLPATPLAIEHQFRQIIASREIRQTLNTLHQLGRSADYLAVDITNAVALSEHLSPLLSGLAPVTGLIHGAGSLADKRIDRKTLQDFETVYAPKVRGLANLLQLIPCGQLQHLLLFSSVSGFHGNAGQTDYALANEVLNKLAHQVKQRCPQCHVVAIGWGAISGGMVTPELKRAYGLRQISILSPQEATAALVQEIRDPHREIAQVMIGGPLPRPRITLNSPCRTQRIRRCLTLAANPFLHHHVIAGYPVLPFTCWMAWLINTCEQFYPGYVVTTVTNAKAFKGIQFGANDVYEVDCVLELQETVKEPGSHLDIAAMIWSEPEAGKTRYHFKASLHLQMSYPDSPTYEAMNLTEDGIITQSGQEFYKSHDNFSDPSLLFHGPLFQGLERILNFSSQKITFQCRLKPISPEQQGQFPAKNFNPYIADAVGHAGWVWLHHFHHCAGLPSGLQHYEQYGNLQWNQLLYVSSEIVEQQASMILANTIVHDRQGRIYSRALGSNFILFPATRAMNPVNQSSPNFMNLKH